MHAISILCVCKYCVQFYFLDVIPFAFQFVNDIFLRACIDIIVIKISCYCILNCIDY